MLGWSPGPARRGAPPAAASGGRAVLACSRTPPRSGAGCWRPKTATPAVVRVRAAATATSGFSLASHIIWITPWARAVTATGTAPAAGEFVMKRAVCAMRAAGIAAEVSRASSGQSAAADGASPRRTSRSRSRCCPRDRRLSTVPTGQPSRRATSSAHRAPRRQTASRCHGARLKDLARSSACLPIPAYQSQHARTGKILPAFFQKMENG